MLPIIGFNYGDDNFQNKTYLFGRYARANWQCSEINK